MVLEELTKVPDDLPPELLHKIFIQGAAASTHFCLTLSTTARWTYVLAYPYLYGTVIVKRVGNTRQFLRTPILKGRSTQLDGLATLPQPHTHVENLWDEVVSENIVIVFRKCEALSRLAIPVDSFSLLVHASTPNSSPTIVMSKRAVARRSNVELLLLDINADWMFPQFMRVDPTKMSPLWGKVTHLWFAEGPDSASQDAFPSHFTNLSHLAIPIAKPDDIPAHLLREESAYWSSIQVVFVIYSDLRSKEECASLSAALKAAFAHNQNTRAVTIEQSKLQSVWEECVRGTLSIWDRSVSISNI